MQHKKLAILVGGELREFASCYPTWRELTDINHDLFISTWDHTEEQNDTYVQAIPNTIMDSLIFRSSMLGHENADWQTLQNMTAEWFDKKHR